MSTRQSKRNFLAAFVSVGLSLPFLAWGGPQSTGPQSPFITGENETVERLTIGSATAEQVQARINEARQGNPDAVLVIEVAGRIVVGTKPLQLGSRMIMSLGDGAEIIADDSTSGYALIEIKDAEFVGIIGPGKGHKRALIDGNTRAPCAIKIINSGKIHLTRLEIVNSVGNGIEYDGRGADRFGDPGTITDCRISGHQGSGAVVKNVAQFVFTDNEIIGNQSAGLEMDSHTSVVIDNIFRQNELAVLKHSENAALSRNAFFDNPQGIRLSPQSRLTLVSNNRFIRSDVAISVDGQQNAIYYNELDKGAESLRFSGSGNILAGHRNVSGAEVVEKLGDNLYFNPPTRSNPHNDDVIVKGKGRVDLEIDTGGPTDRRLQTAASSEQIKADLDKLKHMDLADVQEKVNQARNENPDDYLVVHLKGLFISTQGESGLNVPDNTSVVLNGSIVGMTIGQLRLVLLDGRDFSSFSGGYLDGSTKVAHGIDLPGRAITIIDGVTVSSVVVNGISTVVAFLPHRYPFTVEGRKRGRGSRGRPAFIRGNTVVSTGDRGIWGHVASDIYYIDNVLSDSGADGVDIDGGNHYSAVLFNVMTGNKRSGVFLEEGVRHNIVYGNHMAKNLGRHSTGILFYSHIGANAHGRGEPGRFLNSNNVIAGNHVEGHLRGIGTRNAQNCLIFNNVFKNNQIGFHQGRQAVGNYIAQNALVDNEEDFQFEIKLESYFAFPTAP